MELAKFAAFLRQRRMELNMTQAELAQKLNVTDKAVSRWERGKGYPEVTLLEPLAKALELSLVELMQSKRIEGSLTREEAEAAAAGVLEISRQPQPKQLPRWFPSAAGFAAFIAVVTLGILLSSFLTVPTYMLTRWNPNLTVNDGFADWYAITNQNWSSMEYTAYENGQSVGTTRFWNGLDGAHSVTHRDASGAATHLYGSGSFGYSTTDTHDTFYEIPLPSQAGTWLDRLFAVKSWDDRILSGRYLVSNDRMVSFRVSGQEGTFIKQIELEYNGDTIGTEILRQHLTDKDGNLLGYQRYGWNQYSQCTQIITCDPQDNLVKETVITFQDQVGYGVTRDADGQVLETSKSWFTLSNDLKRRETYDVQGQLIGVEEYHYRIWERFLNVVGFGILAFLWGVGGFIGVEVFLELKKRQKEGSPEPASSKSAAEKTKDVSGSVPFPESDYDVWPYKVFSILFLEALGLLFLKAFFTWEQDSFLNYRADFWLTVLKAIGLALAGTLPAVWIRNRKKQG